MLYSKKSLALIMFWSARVSLIWCDLYVGSRKLCLSLNKKYGMPRCSLFITLKLNVNFLIENRDILTNM